MDGKGVKDLLDDKRILWGRRVEVMIIVDYVGNLVLDAGKNHFKCKLDEQKLRQPSRITRNAKETTMRHVRWRKKLISKD